MQHTAMILIAVGVIGAVLAWPATALLSPVLIWLGILPTYTSPTGVALYGLLFIMLFGALAVLGLVLNLISWLRGKIRK